MTKLTLKGILDKHTHLDLMLTALEESINLIKSEFGSRDGLPPKNIVLTKDGKRVPPHIFSNILHTLEKEHVIPLRDEITHLEEMKIDD
jgi:hypothetical protein